MEPEPDPADLTMTAGSLPARTFASGRYVVLRPLGAGGQKSVYLVHDNALDRDCALALIRNEDLEPDDLLRFQREAQAMARLGAHSNIVSVFDIGEQDGRPFLVSEYIAGGDLRQLLLKRGRLALAEALAVGSDIARALAVAHARGVVHRDIKPLNIWLTEEGAAKLGDFGLAFSLDRSRLTMPGTVMGTAPYLSPEQALGEPVTERSDLYALGCLLYEMVCGRPPFADANATAVIAQHLNAAPTAPSSHEPDVPPALEDLILRLLSKSPAQRPESASAVLEELRAITAGLRTPDAPPEPEPEELENPPPAPGFVGRTSEQGQLAAALDRTIGGAGSLTMVVGEPGIGKTRLLEQFAAHARSAGARVLVGRCYDGDWAPPFSPFVEAIKQYATTASPQRLRAHLSADAGVLARIVPALRERLPNIAEPPAIPAEGERYRLLEAVSDTLGRLAAKRPLVLVLDDLHWADKGTITMLQQVARTSSAQRVLVLGAYRDVELDRTHPLADALAGLRREKHFERIALRGLDRAEVAELLDTIAEQDVPTPLAEAIARETDGNPFFIKEVLLHLVEEGKIVQSDGAWTSKLSIAEMGIPEGVREVIGRRLSRVSETCGRMLTVASALTAGFSWDALKAISAVTSGEAGVGASLVEGSPRRAAPADEASFALTRETVTETRLLDALDQALGAQLIVERERGRYDFTHALIRHTLYEELSTPRRVLLHRQIGEALEQLYAADIEPHVAELAHHYEQGEDWRKALQFLMKAGEKAAAAYANQDAISFFDRAYQAGQRAGSGGSAALSNAAFQRGTVRTTIGDLSAADDFALAASLAREAGDREAEAVALAERGFVLIYAHEFEQAKTTLNEALAIATAHGLEAEYVVRTYLMELFSDWGRLRERDEQFAATEGMSGGADQHRARAFRAMLVTFSAYWDGRFDVAISAHKAAAPQYEAAHDFFATTFGVWVNALVVAHAGHYEDALSAFAHVIAEGERCGDILFPMRTLNCIGWVYGEIENHERALEQNLRGVEAAIAVDLPDPEVEMNARLNAADNLIALGRLDEAADQLRHVERVVRDPLPPERWMLWRYSQHYYHTQGELQLMQGDAETALMLSEQCLALAEETKACKNIVKARRLRAQAWMALGDLTAAETDIGAALELAIEIANPGQLWRTHEALGDLRRAERRAEDARSAHGDALAVLQQMAASLADDELRDTLLKSAAVRRLQERTSS